MKISHQQQSHSLPSRLNHLNPPSKQRRKLPTLPLHPTDPLPNPLKKLLQEKNPALHQQKTSPTPKPKRNQLRHCPPPLNLTLIRRKQWTPSTPSWSPNSPVPYSALCGTFDTISSTTKRLEILSHLAKFYRTVIETTPSNLLQCVYLTINRIAPDYEGLELGIGEGLLVKAIAESSGRSVAQIKSELEKTGDLGDIAQVHANYMGFDFRNQKEHNRRCLNLLPLQFQEYSNPSKKSQQQQANLFSPRPIVLTSFSPNKRKLE